MSGCELAVIINSGSGNQGMTASDARSSCGEGPIRHSKERLYRSLLVSNLITIHLKSRHRQAECLLWVSSVPDVVLPAASAIRMAGICDAVSHTLVNAIASRSPVTVCDGAKPSCAAKIASAVEAGLLGYEMYRHGQSVSRWGRHRLQRCGEYHPQHRSGWPEKECRKPIGRSSIS